MNTPTHSETSLPDAWRASVQSRLSGKEETQAWLEINLDTHLNFSPGLLLITGQRLLAFDKPQTAIEYHYRDGLRIQQHDHGGVGCIELFDGDVRLACWFYTLALNSQATRFVRQFEQQLSAFLTGMAIQHSAPEFCPDCLTPYPDDRQECPHCSGTINAPPSTWTLFRLWRFARPYRWQLLSGFLLMLGSTAATLVPPYLTIPLMDRVLIPYQNGVPIDFGLVAWLLAGLFGSALLACGLGWAKT